MRQYLCVHVCKYVLMLLFDPVLLLCYQSKLKCDWTSMMWKCVCCSYAYSAKLSPCFSYNIHGIIFLVTVKLSNKIFNQFSLSVPLSSGHLRTSLIRKINSGTKKEKWKSSRGESLVGLCCRAACAALNLWTLGTGLRFNGAAAADQTKYFQRFYKPTVGF